MRLEIPRAKRVSDSLFVIVLSLILLSLAGQYSKYSWGHPKLKGFVPIFYLDYESTVPTWYSATALGLAGSLLALIAVAKYRSVDAYRLHWATLSGLLFFLSADEIATFHELPIDPLREAFGAGGMLYYTWVIPGMFLVGIVACLYLRFFFGLPRRTQYFFLLAATTFVVGAIGVEMLSGVQADRFGEENWTYALIITLEEFLEMIGVVLLVRALVDYIHTSMGRLRIEIATEC